MESITIRPKDRKQLRFLKNLLGNLRWDLDVEYRKEKEIAEEDKFYPILQKKIDKALKEREQGISFKVNTESFEKFMESI